jgi:flagellin-like protein
MDDRGVTPVIGVIIMVAVAVILGAVISGYVFGIGGESQSPAPSVVLEHEVIDNDGDRLVAVTLAAGESVAIDRVYVTGSKDLDVGGGPGSGTAANPDFASSAEPLAESSGDNPPQVDIGDTWESGETVYLAVGDNDPEGVTIRVYWTSGGVEGVNPGTVTGDDTYRIAEFVV